MTTEVKKTKAVKDPEVKKRNDDYFNNAVSNAIQSGLIAGFPQFTDNAILEKLGRSLETSIVSTLIMMRSVHPVDAFPPEEYATPGKKVERVTKAAPVKKRAPVRRGASVVVEEEELEVQPDTDDKSGKKQVVCVTRSAKLYLAFVMCGVMEHVYPWENVLPASIEEAINTADERKEVCILEEVVKTVKNYPNLVDGMIDYEIENYLVTAFRDKFKSNSSMLKQVAKCAQEYIKLLGYHVALQLWTSRTAVKDDTLELAVRSLQIRNEPLNMLSVKWLADARKFVQNCTLPKAVKSKTDKTDDDTTQKTPDTLVDEDEPPVPTKTTKPDVKTTKPDVKTTKPVSKTTKAVVNQKARAVTKSDSDDEDDDSDSGKPVRTSKPVIIDDDSDEDEKPRPAPNRSRKVIDDSD